MPAPRNEASTRAASAPRPDGRAASARTAAPTQVGNRAPPGAPRPDETGDGTRRRPWAERGIPKPPEAAALPDLLRGLRAGDLECVLLTVAMAADENRMPSTDPDEEARILAFLARLAEHDAALPPPPDGLGVRSEGPSEAD